MLMDMAGAIANINGNEQFYIYDAYGNLLNMAASAAQRRERFLLLS